MSTGLPPAVAWQPCSQLICEGLSPPSPRVLSIASALFSGTEFSLPIFNWNYSVQAGRDFRRLSSLFLEDSFLFGSLAFSPLRLFFWTFSLV